MAQRVAVLVDERDNRVGSTMLPETIFVVRHSDRLFVRTDKGVRLRGGGIGVIFRETEIYVRERLDPA